MKATLVSLFRDTLEEITLDRVLPERVRVGGSELQIDGETLNLAASERVTLAAFGKAAYPMASTVARSLAPRPVTGVAVGPTVATKPIPGIETILGSHPYPDEGSLRGARALLQAVGFGSSSISWPVRRGLLTRRVSGGSLDNTRRSR